MKFGDGSSASLADALAYWRLFPWKFHDAQWGYDPEYARDPWQDDGWHRLTGKRPAQIKESYQSCAGAGKSCDLAQKGIWALTCMWEPAHPILITAFSMNAANLKSGLWRELKLWIDRSEFLSAILDVRGECIINKLNPDSMIEARTWPARSDPDQIGDALSGLHGRYKGYLGDEAGSIHSKVLNRCEQGVGEPGQWGMILLAGNPADPDSMLGAAAARSDYVTTEITADPDDPNRTPRKTVEYARNAIKEAGPMGREDPWVRVYILGKFPRGGVDRLLSPEAIAEAQERRIDVEHVQGFARIAGLDCGAGGLDPSVLRLRQGPLVFPRVAQWRGMRGTDGAREVDRLWSEHAFDAVAIDMTGGFGATWFEGLQLVGREPLPVIYSGRADDPEQYANVRSEILWRVREGVLSTWVLPDPETPGALEFLEEATEIRYSIVKGCISMEPKDKLKIRLGRSCDELDALANTTRYAVQPLGARAPIPGGGQTGTVRAKDRVRSDWT